MAIRLLDVLKSQICRSQSAECSQQSKDKAGEGRELIATCLITVSLATLICHQDVTNVVPKYVIPIVWESINSFRAYLDTTNGAAT